MKWQFRSCHFYLHGKMGKWASTYSNACQKIPDVIINVNNILFILVYHLVKTNHWERTVSICGTKKERYLDHVLQGVLLVFFRCSSYVHQMFFGCSSDVHQMFFRHSWKASQHLWAWEEKWFWACSLMCSSGVLQMFPKCESVFLALNHVAGYNWIYNLFCGMDVNVNIKIN